jgi:hypothetical protein
VTVYIRAKIGFCNCSTGVADDEELDRISDFDLIGNQLSAQGRAADHGRLDEGRSRAFRCAAARAAVSALSVGFNDRCDAIVATRVAGWSACRDRAGRARIPQQPDGAALGRGDARPVALSKAARCR